MVIRFSFGLILYFQFLVRVLPGVLQFARECVVGNFWLPTLSTKSVFKIFVGLLRVSTLKAVRGDGRGAPLSPFKVLRVLC